MQTEELQKLLSEMSLDEKIGECFQLPSVFFGSDNITGPAAEYGLTPEDVRIAGSCLSVIGAQKLNEIQRTHMENHPHHIPMLFMADIINGYRTVFPVPLAQGCTFDPALVEKCASIAAAEASASGIHVTFSPMADLVQDARWGRVMESTGEDPWLNGLMAAAMVRGYQGEDNDLSQKGKIASCLKHFAGYGAPLGGRDYNTVELSERTLMEDYLPAYRSAVDAGCALVMTSFNTLNRIPSTANRWLLWDVLRRDMAFSGVVITDWNAIKELLAHGIAADEEEAVLLAINAGVDIDMVSALYPKHLKQLIIQHKVPEALLDEAVLRILTLKNRLGLFEHPFKDSDPENERALLRCQNHRSTAKECAEKSFVLLKNENDFLPLRKEAERIAFIGPFVDNKLLCGSWSFFADDEDCVTVKEGIQQCYPDAMTFFAPGCPVVNPGQSVIAFKKEIPKETVDPEEALKEALELAQTADKVILLLGEPRDYTGECASRADITLPSCQLKLFQRVVEANPNTGVVLFNGRPLDIREISEHALAILDAWLPGTEGGIALAEILFGEQAPSGKLAMSFPYSTGQAPVYYNHLNTGRPLSGDYRQTRYHSQYLDIPNDPLYPFGCGLSYTTFSCSAVTLDKNVLHAGETIHASVRLTNTGKRTGTETLQLYIRDVAASVARPVRELKGIRKVTLAPGECQDVTFSVTEDMLRFYDIHMEYRSEPGRFELYIGSDSTTDNAAVFTLEV